MSRSPARRFDARFFVALLPDGQEPGHNDGEIVDWERIRPADALWRPSPTMVIGLDITQGLQTSRILADRSITVDGISGSATQAGN